MGGVAELQLLGQDVEVIFGTTFWGVSRCTSSVVEALEVLPPGSVFYLQPRAVQGDRAAGFSVSSSTFSVCYVVLVCNSTG